MKLLQQDVAERIGTNETSIYLWENNRATPSTEFIPQIIKFLGYVPFSCPPDTLGRLAYFKRVNGLTFRALGKVTGINFEQLTDWLGGRMKPLGRNIERIERFLATQPKNLKMK